MSGALQLKKKPQEKEEKKESVKKKLPQPVNQTLAQIKSESKSLDFGIKIEMASAPYSRTKVVTIVPRYIIVNNLDFPIVVR